jgi:hypothetical protein
MAIVITTDCVAFIIHKVAWNQSSLLPKYFPKHTNITTNFKQRLFTKVIRESSKEDWVSLDRV